MGLGGGRWVLAVEKHGRRLLYGTVIGGAGTVSFMLLVAALAQGPDWLLPLAALLVLTYAAGLLFERLFGKRTDTTPQDGDA